MSRCILDCARPGGADPEDGWVWLDFTNRRAKFYLGFLEMLVEADWRTYRGAFRIGNEV